MFFYLIYGLIWTIAWLPLGALYVLSDLIFPVVYHLIRYRRKVVRKNLTRAFPDYSQVEIINIEKRFYHFFCDLLMEIIRQLHAPVEEMSKRMTVENPELLYHHAAEGKSIMLMLGHYCNWEWISVFGLQLPPGLLPYPVYQKLKNKHYDKMMIQLRSRFGAVSVERNSLIRKMVEMKQSAETGIYVMISDQSPKARNIRHRMQFLNQETPVFLGTEQLAKKYHFPVYYLDIQRVKRGHYHAKVKPIAVDPLATEDYEITETFMRLLEESIVAHPEFWLWSHNRWKHAETRNE